MLLSYSHTDARMGSLGASEVGLSSETVGYALAFFGGYMTKTENERYWGVLAATKPSRTIVYTLISDTDVQSRLGVAADSESAVIIADDLRKEAENFLSSIVLQLPLKGIGVTPQDWFDGDELDRDHSAHACHA